MMTMEMMTRPRIAFVRFTAREEAEKAWKHREGVVLGGQNVKLYKARVPQSRIPAQNVIDTNVGFVAESATVPPPREIPVQSKSDGDAKNVINSDVGVKQDGDDVHHTPDSPAIDAAERIPTDEELMHMQSNEQHPVYGDAYREDEVIEPREIVFADQFVAPADDPDRPRVSYDDQ